jgi:hypothetical protein
MNIRTCHLLTGPFSKLAAAMRAYLDARSDLGILSDQEHFIFIYAMYGEKMKQYVKTKFPKQHILGQSLSKIDHHS